MRTYVEELFHAVADLSLEERTRYFADRGVDVGTRREVEELLEFDSTWDLPLEGDISQIARRVLERLEAKGLDSSPRTARSISTGRPRPSTSFNKRWTWWTRWRARMRTIRRAGRA